MASSKFVCDPEVLEDYLSDRIDEVRRTTVIQHLSDCESCRRELADRAADSSLWDEAVHWLGGADESDCIDATTARVQVAPILEALAPTDNPEMLGRLGEYEISGVVGVGGMGAVLKGIDPTLRRVVAIKVMAPHLADSGTARMRFQRESRAAAAITHDNVIEIYGVSESGGLPYLVMPFARGPSLQKRISQSGPLSAMEVTRIARQIASGLAAAHEQGVVHRDIKPANILLNEGIERLWITDFGVARAIDDASMTQTGVIAGTPQYMSPEQARGEAVDQCSDLFSLGSVLYTACTGRPPFRAETAFGILRRITDAEPRGIREINPDVPEWLVRIIEKLLAKSPDDRFQSASELASLLDDCLSHLQHPNSISLPLGVPASNFAAVIPSAVSHSATYFSKGILAMLSAVVLSAVALFAYEATSPPNLSGAWEGERWKSISLSEVRAAPGWYTGTVASQDETGTLSVRWSRWQKRFVGEYRFEDGESGSVSIRRDDSGQLRGAIAIDADVKLSANAARLWDFRWARSDPATAGLGRSRTTGRNDSVRRESAKVTGPEETGSNVTSPHDGRFGSQSMPAMRPQTVLMDSGVPEMMAMASGLADRVQAKYDEAQRRKQEMEENLKTRASHEKKILELRRQLDLQLKQKPADFEAHTTLGFSILASLHEFSSLVDTQERRVGSAIRADEQLRFVMSEVETVVSVLELKQAAATKRLESRERLLDIARRRFESGDESIAEVLRMEETVVEMQASEAQLSVVIGHYMSLRKPDPELRELTVRLRSSEAQDQRSEFLDAIASANEQWLKLSTAALADATAQQGRTPQAETDLLVAKAWHGAHESLQHTLTEFQERLQDSRLKSSGK